MLPPADPSLAHRFFATRGWAPLPFQAEAWAAYARGESGLVHVPTGAGKTYAATLGPLAEIAGRGGMLLYVSPLRAMARDIETALRAPVEACGLAVKVDSRTGDTSSAARARQRRTPPEVLVTTPESLSVLLTEPDAPARFAEVRAVVVDEWHELVDGKRGTQVELALARLRTFSPGLRTWALTATLSNVDEAARAAVGVGVEPTIVRAELPRPVEIETLLPPSVEDLPWAGHMGLGLAGALADRLDPASPTLVFCNTRAQAEIWFQKLASLRPEWVDRMGLHHGSVDAEERERVELGIKHGALGIVVCTSSLDLGVDLAPVERVVQIGSPKGIARLVQRAGRAGHRPGATCHVLCVPTHALQLVEIAAAREALARGEVEPRTPMRKPLDVLAQHLVTCAMGGGFDEDGLFAEVRRAWSYRDLTREEFEWALALVRDGGRTLAAYPDFHKVRVVEGRYGVPDARIARMHRASIGTITSEGVVQLRVAGHGNVGTIDEGFVARLRPGQRFAFAGRALEFVGMRDLVAQARPAKKNTTHTAHWPGARLPITGSLGAAVRRTLDDVRAGRVGSAEIAAALPILAAQAEISRVPSTGRVLAETCDTSEGHHLFLYPFEGRRVHDGLAALLALRMARIQPATFTMIANDYGMEFLCPAPFPWAEALTPALFREEGLYDDVLASVDMSELARRRFRDVARVAGLVNPGHPGQPRTGKQIHASASLLYDVFRRYDPDNLLLTQARREVIEQQFEQDRLLAALARLRQAPVECVPTARPSPFAMPLLMDRLSHDSASTETPEARLARLLGS
ncbi:MAG: ligase-associated DNA damage response DEXH box helicase [Myxococcota bacterium]